jgi:DNA repair protein RecN (Recombination protein N)
MISYLRVRNLAIVEDLEIEIEQGPNVLTGETGAGKSLLIDSLQFLSGSRGTTDLVRQGEERLTAEALVTVPRSFERFLDELGIEYDAEDDRIELVIRRELRSNGRGRAQINGEIVTVRDLQALMEMIVEIHGQNTSIGRIGGRNHREMLDAWSDSEEVLTTTARAWGDWRELSEKLEELRNAQRDRVQRLDLLEFQIRELSAAGLDPDEEEGLRSERAELSHAVELAETINVALDLVSESEDAALSLVGRASSRLEALARKVSSVEPLYRETEEVLFRLQEISRSLSSMAATIRHDPQRLDEVEERLALIERMKRKYGDSVAEIVQYLDRIRSERDELIDYDSTLEQLEKRESEAFEVYREGALRLSAVRKKAAAEMQIAIETHLEDLAMERTRVVIEVGAANRNESRFLVDGTPVGFGREGIDSVRVLVAANPGEEPRPLEKVASGGELSRIQLAIAAALADRSPHTASSTFVFDEIDAGVGGRVAEVVGRKLRSLGDQSQLLCVTHLPQIAGMGSTHFHVWKESDGARTLAKIRRLGDEEERVEELARMLAGATITESARVHARELLQQRSSRKGTVARPVS